MREKNRESKTDRDFITNLFVVKVIQMLFSAVQNKKINLPLLVFLTCMTENEIK